MAKKSIPANSTKKSLAATQAIAREAWQIAYSAYMHSLELRAMFHAIRSEIGECPRSAAAGNAVALAGIGRTIAGSYMDEFDAKMIAVREQLMDACVPVEYVEGM